MNNRHHPSQISIEVQLESTRIMGNTYPHRSLLKKMGCLWKPEGKYWEIGHLTEEEKKILDKLGLEVSQKISYPLILVTLTPIDTLYMNSTSFDTLIGYVKELEEVRSFKKKDGTIGYFQRFVLVDNSGCISCIIWNLMGARNLKDDSLIALQNYTIKTINNSIELHCSDQTKFLDVRKIPAIISKLNIEKVYDEWVNKDIQSINRIHLGYNQKVKGMITDIVGLYDYRRNGENQLMVILILDDQTEAIKISLFGDMCELLFNFKKEEKKTIISLSPLERIDSSLLRNKINQIIGQNIIVRGFVEKNEYTGLLEMKVNMLYLNKF